MENDLVSIIMGAYNCEREVEKCIESALSKHIQIGNLLYVMMILLIKH